MKKLELTNRELEVTRLLARGLSDDGIAQHLGIEYKTAVSVLHTIYVKMAHIVIVEGRNKRCTLVALAIAQKLLSTADFEQPIDSLRPTVAQLDLLEGVPALT